MSRARHAGVVAVALVAIAALVGCASSRRPDAGAVPSGWPVPPGKASISSVFGERRSGSAHQGLDLTAPHGTPVVATASGRVTFCGRSSGYGRLVVIDHGNGWETRYAHLHRIKVAEGWRVQRGDRIGSVGRSGNASGDHLHYEIRHDGIPVDPRPTLGAQ